MKHVQCPCLGVVDCSKMGCWCSCFSIVKAKLMTTECKKRDAAIILIVVGYVAVIVSWIVVVRNEKKWMQRMNEKSNNREEDKLVIFLSLLSLASSTCGWTCKKAVKYCFSKITVLPHFTGGTYVLNCCNMW